MSRSFFTCSSAAVCVALCLGGVLALDRGARAAAQGRSGAPAQADWPQWRGPTRDGLAASFAVPATWPEQLTRRWKTEVGLGYATPLVVGNRIYIFSRQGENEAMSALDAAKGTVLWKTDYPAPFTMNNATARHGAGPKSTPVFANGRLFSIGMTGIVTALDAVTGKQLWQKPGSPIVPIFTTHSFSPLVERNVVVFHTGGHNQGAITAFDVTTGEVKWSWNGDGPSYGSPIVADLDGTRQIITLTQGKLVGVDAATGALLWERPFVSSNFTNAATPILHGRTLILSNGGPAVAVTVAKRGSQWATESGWENPDVPFRLSNAVLAGDMIFGLSTGWELTRDHRSTSAMVTAAPAIRAGSTVRMMRTGETATRPDVYTTTAATGEIVRPNAPPKQASAARVTEL
jgi:outer membrane protein assembly factor BamB